MFDYVWNIIRNTFAFSSTVASKVTRERNHREYWSPWKVSSSQLWNRRDNPFPCDPVTCSECPGGERCCTFTPQGE